jgi:tetratricopeptide (TPR) repeat protein/sporulation protein YlmC with PRC-barrel domain
MKSFKITLFALACLGISATSYGKVSDVILDQKKAVVTIYIEDNGKVIVYGSGFIIDGNGTIVTNYHVIEPWEKTQKGILYIKKSDGVFLEPIKIIAVDGDKDVALIRVKENNLSFIKMAIAYKASQGEDVVVIGTPLGFETTVTNGIISGIRGDDGFLQISAPVSPGNSGSPVLNSKGEAIGVATLIMTGGQNLNFAIPVSYVNTILAKEKSNQPKGLRNTSATAPSDNSGPRPVEVPEGTGHKGKVLQAMQAGTYTYLDIDENGHKLWIAVMNEAIVKEGVKIGDTIEFPDSPPMYNFQSKELKKTFDSVIFSAGLKKVINNTDDLSIGAINRSIELDPKNPALYYKRATHYLSEMKYPDGTPEQKTETETYNLLLCAESLNDLNRAITLNNKLAGVFAKRAELVTDNLYCNNNNISQAVSDYESAINLDPTNPQFWISKGWLHVQLKEMKKLLECAKRATTLSPKNESGYYLYGSYYIENGNYTKALEYIKKGLLVSGNSTFGFIYVDQVMEKSKKYDDAIKLYSDLIKQNPNKRVFYTCRAGYYTKVKNFKKAIADYTSAINLDNSPFTYGLRADCYYNDGNKVAALSDYQKACEMQNELFCKFIPIVEADIRRGDKWVFFASSDTTSWYYDKTSIEWSKNKVASVWQRAEITDKEKYVSELGVTGSLKDKYKSISHVMYRFDIDCVGKRSKFISSHAYSDSGTVLNTYTPDNTVFDLIIPETIGYKSFEEVCKDAKADKESKKRRK